MPWGARGGAYGAGRVCPPGGGSVTFCGRGWVIPCGGGAVTPGDGGGFGDDPSPEIPGAGGGSAIPDLAVSSSAAEKAVARESGGSAKAGADPGLPLEELDGSRRTAAGSAAAASPGRAMQAGRMNRAASEGNVCPMGRLQRTDGPRWPRPRGRWTEVW